MVSNASRRNRTLLLGAIPVVMLLVGASIPAIPGTNIDLTVPYAAQGKGPTFNTLGEVEGAPVVDVVGTETFATSGHLNMTTVAVRTQMTLGQAVARWLSTDDVFVPIEQIFPSGVSQSEVEESNAAAFASSESNATVAAMRYLQRPIEAVVVDVSADAPADGLLQLNDVIVRVNDAAVDSPAKLAELIQSYSPGDTVELTVQRVGDEVQIPVTLGERDADGQKVAFLGVTSVAQPAGGVRVQYNLKDIGGPSAGLMFSLAVVDKLTPGELTQGAFIAGTGSIDASGEVGPIGGITHKIDAAAEAGAEAFLVPAANCAEATTARAARAGDITLLRVDSLEDAIADITAFVETKDAEDKAQLDRC